MAEIGEAVVARFIRGSWQSAQAVEAVPRVALPVMVVEVVKSAMRRVARTEEGLIVRNRRDGWLRG